MRKEKQIVKVFLMMFALLLVATAMGGNSVQAASRVKISHKSVTLYTSQTKKLKVTGAKKVKWTSTNKKVAKVNAKGKVTAIKKGNAVIKAKAGTKTLKCKVKVKAPVLSDKKLTLEVGENYTLKLYGAKIKKVSSSDPSVAKVTKKGKITAKDVGITKITVKGKNGKKYICTVMVEYHLPASTVTPVPTATPAPTVTSAPPVTPTPNPDFNRDEIFQIRGVNGLRVIDYKVESNTLILYGYGSPWPEFTLDVAEGVTYKLNTSVNEGYPIGYAVLKYQEQICRYNIEYRTVDVPKEAFRKLKIHEVISPQITGFEIDEAYGCVVLYGNTDSMPSFELDVPEGVEYTVDYENNQIELLYGDYSLWYGIRYRQDYRILGVEGIGITDYKYYYEEQYDDEVCSLKLYGTVSRMPEFTLKVSNGINYLIDYEKAEVELFCGEESCIYDITYEYAPEVLQLFKIHGVYGNQITGFYEDEHALWIYGTSEEMPNFTMDVSEGVNYSLVKEYDEYDNENYYYLKQTYQDYAYVREVNYEQRELNDFSIFEIKKLLGDEISNFNYEIYFDPNDTYASITINGGITESMPKFSPQVNEGVAYTMNDEELVLQYKGVSFIYSIYYYSSFEIEDILGEGVLEFFTSYSWGGGYDYSLEIYGVTEEMPEIEVIVEPGVTYQITEDEYEGKLLSLSYGDRTAVYQISYHQLPEWLLAGQDTVDIVPAE